MIASRLRDLSELVAKLDAFPSRSHPILVAIAGAPGSGKSTIAETLNASTKRPSCVVPMDGFHLDNEELEAKGLLHRKGAPQTFDLKRLARLISDLRSNKARHYPTFDRNADMTVREGGNVPEKTEIVLVEGNYLLLDEPGWRELQAFWDASIWLDVSEDVLKSRLIRRWTSHGLSVADAQQRAEENDLVNARRVIANRLSPTWIMHDDG